MEIKIIGKPGYRRFVNMQMRLFFQESFGKDGGQYWEAFSQKEKTLRFAAKEGGKVIGAVSLHIQGKVARIGAFVVSKPFREQGIGSSLIDRCEHAAKKSGCIKVWLFALPGTSAMGFYKKHGYMQEALLRKHFNGKDLCIMSKFI